MMLVANIRRRIQTKAAADVHFKRIVTSFAAIVGYDLTRLTRKAYVTHCRTLIEELGPERLDVIEVAAPARPGPACRFARTVP